MNTILAKLSFVSPSRVAVLAAIRFLPAAFLLATFFPVCSAQLIPITQAATLNGTSVSFPDAASAKPLLFVLGFSHKSSEPCKAWDKRLSPLYLNDSRILYYQAADFQGVPSLILKMILHGMKKEIPANEHSRFVLLQTNEDQWKSVAQFSAPDEAYILLSDPAGHIVWQTHGPATDDQLSALQAAVKAQLKN